MQIDSHSCHVCHRRLQLYLQALSMTIWGVVGDRKSARGEVDILQEQGKFWKVCDCHVLHAIVEMALTSSPISFAIVRLEEHESAIVGESIFSGCSRDEGNAAHRFDGVGVELEQFHISNCGAE